MLIIIQIASANASSETLVKVEPYESIACAGETFTVNITLTDVQNLFGLEVTLNWDASILQIVGIDVRLGVESHPDGILHEISETAPILIYRNDTIQEQGKYILASSSSSPAPSFNGSGNIVRITFNVTNVGSCKLNLETKLANKPQIGGVSSPIAHTTIDGFFSPIHISVSPTMITLGENINISGFIVPARAGVEVTILYRRERETDWRTLPTVETNEQGNYLYTWQPQESGKYDIRGTAVIGDTEVTSPSALVTVEAQEQPIWPYIIILAAVIVVAFATAIVIYRKRIKS